MQERTSAARKIVSDDAVVLVLDRVYASLTRAFYVSMLFSAIALYVLYEERQEARSPETTIRAVFAELLTIRKFVYFHNMIADDPQIVDQYLSFINRFQEAHYTIYSKLKNLLDDSRSSTADVYTISDHLDISLAMKDGGHTGIEQIEEHVLSFKDRLISLISDLRTMRIDDMENYNNELVFGEKVFDNQGIISQLRSSRQIEIDLGTPVNSLYLLPKSLLFHDYLLENDPHGRGYILQQVRNRSPSISDSIPKIIAFCEHNLVGHCTLSNIDSAIGEGFLPQEEGASGAHEKVSLTFFPSGVNRLVVVRLSPIFVVVAFHLFVSQFRRWTRMMESIGRDYSPGDYVFRTATWTLFQTFSKSQCYRFPNERIHSIVLCGHAAIGVVAPIVVTISVTIMSLYTGAYVWALIGSICVALSLIGAMVLVRCIVEWRDPGTRFEWERCLGIFRRRREGEG